MNKIDDTIRTALDAEADEALNDLRQHESLFSLIRDVMHATSMRLTVFAYFIMLFCTAWSVFFAVRFFQAESTQSMIAWAIGFHIAFFSIGMIKLWFYAMANRNTILREIKRVELQIAHLSERLPGSPTSIDS